MKQTHRKSSWTRCSESSSGRQSKPVMANWARDLCENGRWEILIENGLYYRLCNSFDIWVVGRDRALSAASNRIYSVGSADQLSALSVRIQNSKVVPITEKFHNRRLRFITGAYEPSNQDQNAFTSTIVSILIYFNVFGAEDYFRSER